LYPLAVVKLPSPSNIARLNRGDCDCPTGASFTAHTPTNGFLPAGCARSIAEISMYTAAKLTNLFFISASKLGSRLKSRMVAHRNWFPVAVFVE
jgi:hypothetical protein